TANGPVALAAVRLQASVPAFETVAVAVAVLPTITSPNDDGSSDSSHAASPVTSSTTGSSNVLGSLARSVSTVSVPSYVPPTRPVASKVTSTVTEPPAGIVPEAGVTSVTNGGVAEI